MSRIDADLVLIISNLYVFLNLNEKKVVLWLNTPNPHLGDCSPMKMIEGGRKKKLLKFIESAVDKCAPIK